MCDNSLKVSIEIDEWKSMNSIILLKTISEKVLSHLSEKNLTVADSTLTNCCKNAVSLARSKKKIQSNSLTVYIPRLHLDDKSAVKLTSIPPTSTAVNNCDEQANRLCENHIATQDHHIRFDYNAEQGLLIHTNYVYMKDTFNNFLYRSSKLDKVSNLLNEIFQYCYQSTVKLYVDVAKIRRQLSSQISCYVRDAKKKAQMRYLTATKVLMEMKNFIFSLNCLEALKKTNENCFAGFDTYLCVNSFDRILLVRDKEIICIQPGNSCLYIHISESIILRVLELFDVTRIVDVHEILIIVVTYCQKQKLLFDVERVEEDIKAFILDMKTNTRESNIFTCTVALNTSDCFSSIEQELDLDALLGPVYSTRGLKRKAQIVPLDSDITDFEESSDEDNLWKSNTSSTSKHTDKRASDFAKSIELKRKFLHIKDEYHITDSAIKAMHQFFKENKNTFFSMAELEKVRSKANEKIPIQFTKDSAYVPFEFALRVAVFVAMKFRPDILQLNKLLFRLNMDGTLMGNKHVVAISVNCVDGGPSCQTAKRLVPVGIFEIQKESNELLRKTLPKEFLDSIQSVKYLNVTQKKSVTVKIKLGGDFQNAVYVFGLAGVNSNYPCVFCTQNKSYLHVMEKNTEIEEEVWVGTGKSRKKEKRKILISPTSSYDPTLGARSLEEKRFCLSNKKKTGINNQLGYQSEPLFGDLFEFSDYVIDSLHMRLRIFDILLKDILAEASRTGEYEPLHTKKLEEKIEILNQHAIHTIGKRFFFKIETENNVKSIVPCGRFSGHLQQSLFVDSFPYEKIIKNDSISKSAKNLVNRFKFILELIRTDKSKRTGVLADVAKSFVNEYRQSGLRTGCTPYMHLIGTHLAEQDEHEDLCAFDMQGVEKSNDLLSRLYFSSSNRAKMPLRTMMQNLYRRIEMNFTEPEERIKMSNYAVRGTFDETDDEDDNSSSDNLSNHRVDINESIESSSNDCEYRDMVSTSEEENLDQAPSYVRKGYVINHENKRRWKTFRK